MRAISLVKRLEFDFVGNVFQNALALGDVDNDGHNELIVGNMNGDLSIFKYDRLWQKLDGLGMITAIAVGDILNCGSNALVVISGDGWCHILTKRNVIGNSKLQRAGRMESFHVQRIPANTKVVLLADIDGDGQTELVLGLTDRIVRSYRWLPGGENSSPRLFTLSKWEGANQIGAVTLNRSADGSASVLVSQPGGAYIKISCDDTYNDLNSSISTEGEGLADSTVEYHPLSLSRMRSPNVSTEILGGIRPPIGSASPTQRYAVATLDGTIMLVDNQEILWSMQVEQQVFGIRALDITGDGGDEIVACAWSGQTYFLDQQRRCVRFQMDQPVAGFTAGPYAATAAAGNRPTLVYTTFSNKICVYPDVRVPTMVSRGVQPLPGDLSPSQQRELAEWCLYGKR